MPVAVFRRYTPPTCTLELRGERSPLSAWSDRPIVKQVQFILNIDGPQRPQEQRVTLKGGRTQLDHLHIVVDAYVQQTLGLSAHQFQSTLLQPSPSQSSAPTFNASPAATGQALASPGRINDMGWARSPSPDITLTPKGLLKHELQLGKLAPHSSVPSVLLNTTELFDLAHALDSYHGEVDSIPELNPVQRRGISPWVKGAAAAVLAVGVTATLVNVLQVFPNASFQSATGESAESSDALADQQLAQRSAPTALPPIELDDIPSANEALPPGRKNRDAEKTSADDDILDSTFADEETEGQPRDASQDQEEAIALSPTRGQDRPNAIATDENRLDSAQATLPSPNLQANAPEAPRTGTASSFEPNTTVRSPVASTPLPAEIAAAGTLPNTPRPSPSTSSVPNAGTNTGVSGTVAPDIGAIELDSADLPPELTSIPPIPTIESGLDPLADTTAPAPPRQTVVSGQRSGVTQGESKEPQAHSVSAETQRTEVQTYFESQWQPPEELNQALQYRLVFNADGSLQQTIPLGESARAYRSNVNLPTTGEPFVSAFGGNDTPPMRLFLGANGQVRVFIESLD